MLSRARRALIREVETNAETAKAVGLGVSATLRQVAGLLGRNTESDDEYAVTIAGLMPVVEGKRVPLLAEYGSLVQWIELMIRTEKMDRLWTQAQDAAEAVSRGATVYVIDVGADGRPMTVDGMTRGRRG